MKTILLVEDDEALRDMLSAFLESHDFVVFTANNGERALEIANTHALSAVVTDYQMSGMDGLALCQALREREKNKPWRLPIWMITGYADLSAEQAIAAGAEALVRKPFSPITIVKLVERYLESRLREASA